MFGKITKQHVANALRKSKNCLGHAHHQTKALCLNHVDHGMRTFKQIYGAVAPRVDTYANKQAANTNSNVNKAIEGYENIHTKIIEGNDDIQNLKHKMKIKGRI